MARISTLKAKTPIRIREKKLNNGNKSLYLDIYRNGQRSYEFLQLYIIPERTPADRATNKNTYQAAELIRAQRMADIVAKQSGQPTTAAKHLLFADWLRQAETERTAQGARFGSVMRTAAKHWTEFAPTARLADINKTTISAFIDNLRKKGLSQNSIHTIYSMISLSLRMAYKRDMIPTDPTAKIEDKPAIERVERAYLTAEELARFTAVQSSQAAETKRAFLFSCYTGLRLSDIENLRYSDIESKDGRRVVSVTMQKTGKTVSIPLSQQASDLIEYGIGQVFNLPARVTVSRHLTAIAERARIEKRVTFHTARHTFATLSLSSGTPIEVVSSLLGHADIQTTQIYAKVVSQAKQQAIDNLERFLSAQ